MITESELKVLKAIADSEYVDVSGYNDPRLVNYSTWMSDVSYWSGISGKEFSGVCSSLTKKGYITSDTTGDTTMLGVAIEDTYTIAMTQSGFDALQTAL